MGIVVLASGGVDSAVISVLSKQEGLVTYPLFLDYGQICVEQEWLACVDVHRSNSLPPPTRMSVAGFGQTIPSGLTNLSYDIVNDAFLPCRNLLFAICGAAFAYSKRVHVVALGLLDESQAIFPDQTSTFIEEAEKVVRIALGSSIRIIAPLITTSKTEVLALADQLGIKGTYSCHKGTDEPCGRCISCMERIRASQSI
jgi:7-cyano-7-deazaguanine synthase